MKGRPVIRSDASKLVLIERPKMELRSGIEMSNIKIATPFNKLVFLMNPSKIECDETSIGLHESDVIAMACGIGGGSVF